ncbi:MAG: hypothetical protein PHD76_09845 [Methylacidiphilales bacterium]|nr:hypothetical protein [Candidatus Methylacidiphilales bacterium]
MHILVIHDIHTKRYIEYFLYGQGGKQAIAAIRHAHDPLHGYLPERLFYIPENIPARQTGVVKAQVDVTKVLLAIMVSGSDGNEIWSPAKEPFDQNPGPMPLIDFVYSNDDAGMRKPDGTFRGNRVEAGRHRLDLIDAITRLR